MSRNASPAQPPIDPVYRRIMWRLLPILCLCYIISLVERANIGVAKLEFAHQLGFSNAVYGLGAGIFYLGFFPAEIPSNLYMAKIGARKTLTRIMLLWGPACAGVAFMTQPWHFYALRVFFGAAEAGLFPGILLYMTYWIPMKLRARFIALLMSGIPIAGMIGGPVGGWLMTAYDGVGGLQGWQWLFILEAIPAIVLAVTVFLYLDDRPEQARWLTDEEKARVARDLAAEEGTKSAHTHGSFGAALRDPRIYAISVLGLGIQGGYGGTVFWLPTIIRDSGVHDILYVGLLSGLPFVVAIVVQYLVARRSDRRGERRWHAAALALVAAAGWFLIPFAAGNPVLTLLTLTLATAGTYGTMGPFWSLPSTVLTGEAMAGGIALISTLGGFGSFASPIIVGWLVDRTGSMALGEAYYGLLFIVGAITIVTVRAKSETDLPADAARHPEPAR